MEHWQFLIQKQGDRSWHTLESLNTEILEGRYRVLARSNRPDTDVEVRVIYSVTEEVPPKRRIQKRSRRTNAEGLMAVVPFTYFQPGVWELQCSGDLMSDILGRSWQYSVHLKVLPQSVARVISRPDVGENAESHNDLDPHVTVKLAIPPQLTINITPESASHSYVDLPTETLVDPVLDQPVSPVWVKGETAEQILQNLIELALPVSDSLLEDKTVVDNSTKTTSPPLLLTLDRENYMACWGGTLTINGQVIRKATEKVGDEPQHLYALELGIELRSPLGAEILSQTRQPLPNKVLPFTINYAIDLPHCESKLILADIGLYGALTDVDEVILLASQSFTITADVTELLAISTALQASAASLEETTAPAVKESEPSAVKLDLSLVNLVKSVKQDQSALVPSSSPSKFLPPQIASRPTKRATSNRVQLPNLPPLPTPAIAASVASVAPKSENILEPDEPITPINPEQLVIRNRPTLIIDGSFSFLQQLPEHQEAANSNVSEAWDSTLSFDEDDAELPPPPNSASVEPPAVTDVAFPFNTPLVVEGNPNSSPLIKKWLQNQGYILPEPIPVPNQDYDTSVPPPLTIARNQLPLPPALQSPLIDIDSPLPNIEPANSLDTESIELETIVASENTEEPTPEITAIQTDLPAENGSQQLSRINRPIPPLPPPHRPQPQPTWLSQEVVVDDTDIADEMDENDSNQELEAQPPADVTLVEIAGEVSKEPLPIPQLYVPEGELISGKSITIRVELPKTRPQVAIKLWLEDCQTRYLLDDPHVLKNLLPTAKGGLEVITQLTIPFGCIEIRLEAIALDLDTQQESHKVTTVRQVVPPDLPALPLDELLGI